QRDRWAYCKISQVVERINQADRFPPSWPELEQQVHVAVDLAPQLSAYGRFLLQEIERCRTGQQAGYAGSHSVAVRHLGTSTGGWSVTETTSFRIFHRQRPEYAEQAADVAERTRATMQQKWFGSVEEPWSLKCE